MASSLSSKSPIQFSKRQALYKGRTPPWKDTYRKRCFDRLRSNRQSLVQKFRQIQPDDEKSKNTSFVKNVMEEEWKILRGEHGYLPTLKEDSSVPDVIDGTDNFEEIFSVMEEIKVELLKEEQEIIQDYEKSRQIDEAALCAAVEKLETDELICPVCRKNPLNQNKSVIFCACGMRIDTEYDCVTLSYVKDRLKEAISQHSRACTGKALFSTLDQCGLQNLVIACKTCDFLDIIL
ncbi:RPA-interacting protein A-like [Saccoglossus kowalevskii]|uniref:RPA-interacting protein A-like n=1 Tax=Saccoglossus kowalevskii TaxID=10224 RepID=A0ABM0MMF1_SACKO|nr:PREDICTED: RPA-interacting protein A-like [Saccoglossus kowalevskii]